MNSRVACLVIIAAAVTVCALRLAAQALDNAPFFSAGATGYEATISTAFAGAPLSATATVSPDRKYVTVGTRAQNLGTPTLRPFTIAVPTAGGFVGSPSAGAAPSTAASLLDRAGITFVAPLR